MCLLSSFVLLCAVQDGGTQKRLVHFNDTSITTVTVFATGAEVTRLVPLEAPVVGNMTIVLVGLPAQLDEGSVRVTADAETLHVREVSEEQHDGKPDSSEAAQERVAGARSELNAAQANKTRIQFQRTNLELYLKARLVTGSGASTISASDAAESLDFYEARMAALDAQLDEARKTCDTRKAELARAEAALAPAPRRAVVVVAEAGTCAPGGSDAGGGDAGHSSLLVRYVVRGARWEPSYDLRVASDGEHVGLVAYGHVTQSSGEDWRDVRLELSTADASEPLAPPKPAPRTLRLASELLAERRRALSHHPDKSAESDDAYPRPPASPPPPSAPPPDAAGAAGGQRQHAASVVLAVGRPASVPSDGRPVRLSVGEALLTARFTHYATPKESARAYLRATMLNAADQPLLPTRKVRVYHDGGFVARAAIERVVGVGANFTTFLGVDHGVSVDVEPETRRSATSSGLFSSAELVTFASAVRVSSRKRARVHIVVQDSVAQSFTDKIAVELLEPRPAALLDADGEVDPTQLEPCQTQAHLANQTGTLTWGAVLGTDGDGCREVRLPLVFTATFPKGEQISVRRAP
mmetsp:Transcript_2569/g.6395  ORF Transcript_2569/g.6395 Transcript_2569/m.6395 type:complete len:582 (+) Transcript_2569:87-1832(+)